MPLGLTSWYQKPNSPTVRKTEAVFCLLPALKVLTVWGREGAVNTKELMVLPGQDKCGDGEEDGVRERAAVQQL